MKILNILSIIMLSLSLSSCCEGDEKIIKNQVIIVIDEENSEDSDDFIENILKNYEYDSYKQIFEGKNDIYCVQSDMSAQMIDELSNIDGIVSIEYNISFKIN